MNANLPKSWNTRLDKLTHTCGCNHCEVAPPEVTQFIEDLEEVYQANNMLQVIRLLNEHTFALDEAAEKLAKMSQLDDDSRQEMRSAAAFTSRDHDK
ncbi:MAG: hypothetical protein WCC87_04010 [Candidatus Korobacteraceae bacterium]